MKITSLIGLGNLKKSSSLSKAKDKQKISWEKFEAENLFFSWVTDFFGIEVSMSAGMIC